MARLPLRNFMILPLRCNFFLLRTPWSFPLYHVICTVLSLHNACGWSLEEPFHHCVPHSSWPLMSLEQINEPHEHLSHFQVIIFRWFYLLWRKARWVASDRRRYLNRKTKDIMSEWIWRNGKCKGTKVDTHLDSSQNRKFSVGGAKRTPEGGIPEYATPQNSTLTYRLF